jgi:tRNA N6-adenosine threonylcarbamoyltransferase
LAIACWVREWGGVVPTLAMEAHKAAIDSTVDTALARANVTAADLAAVAVTVGPGLVMCLQVSAVEGPKLTSHPARHSWVTLCAGRPCAELNMLHRRVDGGRIENWSESVNS